MEGRVCMKDKQGISLSNFRNNLNKATTFRKKRKEKKGLPNEVNRNKCSRQSCVHS